MNNKEKTTKQFVINKKKQINEEEVICDYCGEEIPTVTIDNPNDWDVDGNNTWEVCSCCDKVIKNQKKLTMAKHLHNLFPTAYTQKLIDEAELELKKLEELTGKPTLTVELKKVGV